jgi:hypothetical protein
MRRKVGIVMMAVSIVIAIAMIVLANVTFHTQPVRTGPASFQWYRFTFSPDWKLFVGDAVLLLLGFLCIVIPSTTARPSGEDGGTERR